MEVLSVLLFFVILVLIVNLKTNIQNRLTALESEIRRLRERPLSSTIEKSAAQAQGAAVNTSGPETPATVQKDIALPIPAQSKEPSLHSTLAALLPNEETEKQQRSPSALEAPPVSGTPKPSITLNPAPQPPRVRKPTFMERNPDMERFIGENLVSKIGIAILVLAIGFFVKYAIDNDWIGTVGRVGIGILCGGILAGVGHRMRNSYKAFSSVLAGGGLAIFYFTITLAFHQFHLFSQLVTFIIMVVITGFAVALSQLYNKQELAIIALIGGFATPFMASNGGGNYKALFWYLIILNAGLLGIAYNKSWRLLNLLAFLFTAVLYGTWLFTLASGVPHSTYADGLMFATIFYLLFFIINIAYNIRENKKFIASDFGILLANTCLYFSAGLYLLTKMNDAEYRGLFTASISIFNLAASYILFRNRKIDNNILYLLIGITLSFISLTAPIQLNGQNITLFWAAESVLLYWLFQKSKISIIRLASLLVWVAMIVSLTMDWFHIYGMRSNAVPVIINKGFITTIFAGLASYLLYFLRKKDQAPPLNLNNFLPGKIFFSIAATMLLYSAGAFEIDHQFNYYFPGTNLHILYLLLYTFSFILVFNSVSVTIGSPARNRYLRACLLSFCVLLYLFNIIEIFQIQSDILQQHHYRMHFIAHWLAAVLMAIILYQLVNLARDPLSAIRISTNLLAWIFCSILVIYLSAEMHLLVNELFYSDKYSLAGIQKVYIKTGLPILWGLCSFGFMWLGMKQKFRPLRIISLTLFFVILMKLFIFDIRNIPVAGKIAAFFSLGVLLLVVSFMYQRLKKIIVEDEKTPSV